MVGTQRTAGTHQIDDSIGEADQRGQFHRSIQLDQVHMHALLGEVLARGLQILGRHAQARPLTHGVDVVELHRNGNHHRATCDLQVERLVYAFCTLFVQHVLAGHTQIGRAVAHIGRHVGSTHDDDGDVAAIGSDDELARGFRILERTNARSRQKRQGFGEDAALGQGDGDAIHGQVLERADYAARQTAGAMYGRLAACLKTFAINGGPGTQVRKFSSCALARSR